jgi:UDP-glucose 4-epimerase
MIFSSSATVYGAPSTIPIPETTPLDAQSCYGRTKVMAEWILKDVCDSAPKQWRAIALRYFNPAGARDAAF